MIKMGLEITGVDRVLRRLIKLRKETAKHTKVNKKRATAFLNFTVSSIAGRKLGLDFITPTTIKIQQRGNHPPMILSGDMGRSMKKRKNKDNSYDAGFLASNKQKPKPGATPRGWPIKPKLTYTALAHIHKSGARIPASIDTPKGRRVRAFMAFHDIFLRTETKWLILPRRDILGSAVAIYEDQKNDVDIVERFMNDLIKKAS